MNENIIVAVYGLFQRVLKDENLLDSYYRPLKSKHQTADEVDTIALYDWCHSYLKHLSTMDLNTNKQFFNGYARSLENEYQLNDFLLALFMFENELMANGTRAQNIVLKPKILRTIKHMQEGIQNYEVCRDSKIAASNIIRLFNGEPELTKKMRAYKLKGVNFDSFKSQQKTTA